MIKNFGFLSFGHFQETRGAHAVSAADALHQTIDLAIAAEEIGLDGAWIRVHHYQQMFSSPWPLLSALAVKTKRLQLGTAVIDMRYENPLAMAEMAASADLLSNGRLQLGISRGSQEPALRGYEAFGHVPAEDQTPGDMARVHTERFRFAIAGGPVAQTDTAAVRRPPSQLQIEPRSQGLSQRIWWGSATRASAQWAAEQGMHLMSSTLLSEDTGVPFHELQAQQIHVYKEAWAAAGHSSDPRVSVARSILPITNAADAYLFSGSHDEQVGVLNGARSRFGKSFVGDPDTIAKELLEDTAVQAADTLLVTIPNLLGVDHNARLLAEIAHHVLPALGWSRST